MMEEIAKTVAPILSVVLPIIAALFAFRASERKTMLRMGEQHKIIDYTAILKEIAVAMTQIARNYDHEREQHRHWRGQILSEVTDTRRAIQDNARLKNQ